VDWQRQTGVQISTSLHLEAATKFGTRFFRESNFENQKSRSAKYDDRRFGVSAWSSSPSFKAVLLALQVKRKLYFQSEQSP
jgi:hypothetical protein